MPLALNLKSYYISTFIKFRIHRETFAFSSSSSKRGGRVVQGKVTLGKVKMGRFKHPFLDSHLTCSTPNDCFINFMTLYPEVQYFPNLFASRHLNLVKRVFFSTPNWLNRSKDIKIN